MYNKVILIGRLVAAPESVSYTHLDVYKRQKEKGVNSCQES